MKNEHFTFKMSDIEMRLKIVGADIVYVQGRLHTHVVLWEYMTGDYFQYGDQVLQLDEAYKNYNLSSAAGAHILQLMRVAGVESWAHMMGAEVIGCFDTKGLTRLKSVDGKNTFDAPFLWELFIKQRNN